jgi:glucose-6-phosphate isomerase
MLQLKTDHAQPVTTDVLRTLDGYREHVRTVLEQGSYDAPESSINLPGDDALLIEVRGMVAKKITANLKYNIVIGIGGSNLGTKAVYDALFSARDMAGAEQAPKLLFAETTDPEVLTALCSLITNLESSDEIILTLISKSGGTTETIANFEILMQPLMTKFDDALSRVVAITDEGSKLWQSAQEKGIACIALPTTVGGRYSVFSAVGLFPLASVGVDIAALRQGAHDLLSQCMQGEDKALQSAAVLAESYRAGYSINDNFFFHPELESLGKWYRQLMGESVGKEQSLTGETVHTGITPTVSLGSTDLHSVGQLYLGGPKDKLTTFVSAKPVSAVPVPSDRVLPDLVPMIDGKSAEAIMTAILEGVQIAYQKAELPYMEVVLEGINETSIGAYLQCKMLEMMYLGQLLNVNSFDQPNVEAYKIETKRVLESN